MRTLRVALGVALGITAMLAVPAAAPANPVNDLLNQVGDTVNNTVGNLLDGGGAGGSQGGGAADDPEPRAGTPPNYVPPAHGTNPHGQGTVGIVDLVPENTTPLPYEEGGGSQDVVVGQARGEQNPDGTYHGHITILALLGNELLGVDTNEGESDDGPLGPLNAALGNICTQSGNTLCLSILEMSSETTSEGSTNSFSIVDANVGVQGQGISASAGESTGEIGDDGECQTATGSSEVTNANVLNVVTADVINSESESTACNDGSTSQTNESSAVDVAGIVLPSQDCEDGVPNTVPIDLLGVISVVCNADDSNSTQLDLPYGVREGLSVFLLPLLGDTPLALATTAASESHAVAPGGDDGEEEPPTGPPSGGGDQGGNKAGNEGGGPGDEGEGGPVDAGGPSADAPDKELPFTGADLLILALIGIGVMGTGLAAMALADRRVSRG